MPAGPPHPQHVACVLMACVAGAGETTGPNGLGCIPCGPGSYNFEAQQECTACGNTKLATDQAQCPGGAVLAPQSGYWHSAIDSDYVMAYPNRDACS